MEDKLFSYLNFKIKMSDQTTGTGVRTSDLYRTKDLPERFDNPGK